jgi:thioredoxin 1
MTRVIIGVGLGLAIGAAVGAFLKSRGGSCPLTCNPIGGALFGALLGGLIAWPTARAKQAFASIEHFENVQTIEAFEEKVLQADRLVLVDFYSTTCLPCQRLAPVLGSLSQDYGDRVKFTKTDVADAEPLKKRYNITGYPTILLVKHGEIVDRWMGYRDRQAFAAAIDKALEDNGEQNNAARQGPPL